MFRKRYLIVAPVLAALLVSSCARVPEEAIVLSEDVGVILEELRRKNANLVMQLYADRKARVNTFVDTVYAPAVVKDAIQRTNALNRIAQHVDAGNVDEALDMMEVIVRLSRNRIERTRRELLAPLELQETEIRNAFDENFGVAIKGTETTTGLLRSIRAVHQAQEEALGAHGIKNLRERVNEKTASASRRVGDVLNEASAVDAELTEITDSGQVSLEDANKLIEKLKDLLQAGGDQGASEPAAR